MKRRLTAKALLKHAPLPRLGGDGDKERRGSVLVVGGGAQVPGGVMLSGLGALRAGAGKLAIGTARRMAEGIALAIPEARLIPLPSTRAGEIASGAFAELKDELDVDAMVIGPGMLDETHASDLARRLIECGGPRGFVLDAGAVTELWKSRKAIRSAKRSLVITPHAGEMAALVGCDKSDVLADPVAWAEAAATSLGAVAVLKGAVTHIVGPEGEVWVYKDGSPGLGTSGSGDVLAGVIGGLLARGAPPLSAAAWGVYLHGEAGAALSATVGELGFLAREILAEIPRVLARSQPAV